MWKRAALCVCVRVKNTHTHTDWHRSQTLSGMKSFTPTVAGLQAPDQCQCHNARTVTAQIRKLSTKRGISERSKTQTVTQNKRHGQKVPRQTLISATGHNLFLWICFFFSPLKIKHLSMNFLTHYCPAEQSRMIKSEDYFCGIFWPDNQVQITLEVSRGTWLGSVVAFPDVVNLMQECNVLITNIK